MHYILLRFYMGYCPKWNREYPKMHSLYRPYRIEADIIFQDHYVKESFDSCNLSIKGPFTNDVTQNLAKITPPCILQRPVSLTFVIDP